jgi:hypothetical protein
MERQQIANRASTDRQQSINRSPTERQQIANGASTDRQRSVNRSPTERQQIANRASTDRQQSVNNFQLLNIFSAKDIVCWISFIAVLTAFISKSLQTNSSE